MGSGHTDRVALTPQRNADLAPLTREQFLDAPLVQLYGCYVGLTCFEGCTRPANLDLKLMAAAHGKGLQLRRLVARLKCSACKRKPAEVVIYNVVGPDDVSPSWLVRLVP